MVATRRSHPAPADELWFAMRHRPTAAAVLLGRQDLNARVIEARAAGNFVHVRLG